MGKFEKIVAALEALPEARREEIGHVMERLFYGDLHPEAQLSDDQLADLGERAKNPGPYASAERVAAILARFVD